MRPVTSDDRRPKPFFASGKPEIDRLLSACNDDGLGGILNQIGECGGRVGHGIRSVADDKAVVFFIVCLDGLRHGEPVFWLHIGAVYIEYLKAFRLAELLRIRDV